MSRKGMERMRDPDSEKTKWDETNTKKFLDLCIAHVMKKAPKDKFKWSEIAVEFNNICYCHYTGGVLKNKYDNLKSVWQLWNRLKAKETGLIFDSRTGTVEATDEWWNENPQFKRFRYTPLPFPDECDVLFSGNSVSGGSRISQSLNTIVNKDAGLNAPSASSSPSASIVSERRSGKKTRKEKRKRGEGVEKDNATCNDIFCKWREKKKKVLEEKMEMTGKEWRVIVEKEKLEGEREMIQLLRRKEDLEIMMMDLSALTDMQKKYIESLQAEILAKRMNM